MYESLEFVDSQLEFLLVLPFYTAQWNNLKRLVQLHYAVFLDGDGEGDNFISSAERNNKFDAQTTPLGKMRAGLND